MAVPHVGIGLRLVREDRGLSQNGLSRLSGISQQHISRIEQGAVPGIDVLLSLANALECTPNDLLIQSGLMPGQTGGGMKAEKIYQIAKQLEATEQQQVEDYAVWRLNEQRERYKAGGREDANIDEG